ncbi:MAG: helix-turn-helix transcriptional regulator [Muribaculaceae bacterium]|nr:helix-turn-helix transcriptional regulator [Muribaculaceae bacterium]
MKRTKLATVVKALRKEYGLTQEDLAMKAGVGLCFVRNLEQGKASLRMDKVNQLLDLFNYELSATKRLTNSLETTEK